MNVSPQLRETVINHPTVVAACTEYERVAMTDAEVRDWAAALDLLPTRPVATPTASTIATPANIEVAYAEGRRAYQADAVRSPMASARIREMVGDAPVGAGAADLFRAFLDGWEDASDSEAEAALGE